MALGCGARCAKAVLIIFNLLFWLSGVALIGFGIFILIEEEKIALSRFFQDPDVGLQYSHLQYLAFAFVGIGALVFIVGFFGCCGAIHESKSLLVTYFIFLFLILLCELAVGVLAIYFQEQGAAKLEEKFKSTLKTKYGMNEAFTQAIDLAQTKLECCGVVDGNDYSDSTWRRKGGEERHVTPTCCVLRNADKAGAYLNPHPLNETLCQREDSSNHLYRHQSGCKHKLEEYLKQESMIFLFIGSVAAALEIFGMVFSICLCKEI